MQASELCAFFRFQLSDARRSLEFIDMLQSIPFVETAYPLNLVPMDSLSIEANDPNRKRLSVTPDFSSRQDYLFATEPGSPSIAEAWIHPGGLGEGTTIVDIEYGWDRFHEDLTQLQNPVVIIGGDPASSSEEDHGTAVAGILNGEANGIGITGCAPEASLKICYVMSQGTIELAESIILASEAINPGDIILVEMQSVGPSDPNGHTRFIPAEWLPDVFAAISYATENGRVVIEPSGNSGVNLDDPIYQSRFDRSLWDSGALIVGAGLPYSLNACIFSNYGSRLDLQGWGSSIFTTGYGDAPDSPSGEHRRYTHQFGGTSGASAMVAGTITLIQSIAKTRLGKPLSAYELRTLFAQTAIPYSGNRNIGSLIDVTAAINRLGEPTPEPTPGIFADLHLSSSHFEAGQVFHLWQETQNTTFGMHVTEYLVLEVNGQFFFWHWPDFAESFYGRTFFLSSGHSTEEFLNFTWPIGELGSISGIGIYFCYLHLFSTDCASNLDLCVFDY